MELLRQSIQSLSKDWNSSLIAAAWNLTATHGESALPVVDDLQLALAAKSLAVEISAVRGGAWELIAALSCGDDGLSRAATQITALSHLLRNASTFQPSAITVDDVATLLHGVAQRSMRRWAWEDRPRTSRSAAARWDVENEYHVQDILWAVLAPVFPDLEDEENLPSLGHHHPRADLGIPSLELIIEVKFIRPGPKSVFGDMIQEIAADAGTYLREGSGYRRIIAFL
jgi:DpnII restriction endonuclease